MFINLNQIGGGGGGSYTLPIASSEVLGGVKIGDGINIDSAGTISVSCQTGGTIEVVSSLPLSGYDGQTVLLNTVLQEKRILITGTANADKITSVTAIGITAKTKLWKYNFYNNVFYDIYVYPNNTIGIYNTVTEIETEFQVNSTTDYIVSDGIHSNLTLNVAVSQSGCVFTGSRAMDKIDVINDIDQRNEEKQVLYTWSDTQELTADIDYTTSASIPWCVRFKYSELPNNTTLVVWRYIYSEDYRHLVYENGHLHSYTSSSADTYTATTYVDIAQYGYIDGGRYGVVYWTDDEIIVYSNYYTVRVSINTDALYRNGWHKEIEHKVSNKAFYKDYIFYDEDFNIIIKDNSYPIYDVGVKINPTSSSNVPYNVYSKNNSTIGPIFAPTTTGTTGYVCVAGNGWAAPTWAEPSTLTNGVKFWKGTQAEYDALSGGTGYDSSTLYIIAEE